MGKRIAIFGGTFDPVHIGHVALVVAMQEQNRLDSILIIPANCSPLKQGTVPLDAKHRLQMLKRAFRDLPFCQVLRTELDRPGPSYTIDTIRELKATKRILPKDSLFLIVGEDQLATFSSWKESEQILKEAQLLVASRGEGASAPKTPCFDVSATDIRSRIKRKLYFRHLIDNQVFNYINRHKLYE